MLFPACELLDTIERLYDVRYPADFRARCAAARDRGDAAEMLGDERGAGAASPSGAFIADLEAFRAVVVHVGHGQWRDLERAAGITGAPKSADVLWGGLLPFFVDGDCVYGFAVEDAAGGRVADGRVVVWSEHTLVHEYASFAAFEAAQRA